MMKHRHYTASPNSPTRDRISPDQRFTKDKPCPVCDGYKELPQGRGTRCWGYLSDDESTAYCTREESAGLIEKGENGAYAHRLDGPCPCGDEHGFTFQANGKPGTRYEIRDHRGDLIAVQCRKDTPSGKKIWYERIDVRPQDLPLYGIDRVWDEFPTTVVVCEGGKATDATNEAIRIAKVAETIAVGLAAGVARHDEADRLRRERLAVIDAEIAKLRKRLDALVDALIDAGPEAREAVRRRLTDTEDLIGRLAQEQAELAAVRSEGLSREEATEIETFAAEVRAGMDAASPADRRRVVELLDVRGTVSSDPNGIVLGRKHRFVIDWTARIQLSNKGSFFKNSK